MFRLQNAPVYLHHRSNCWGFRFWFFIWFLGRKSLLCSPKLPLFDQKQ